MARARSKPKAAAAASSTAVKLASVSSAQRAQSRKKSTASSTRSGWSETFSRAACVTAHWMGKPVTFLGAVAVVIAWAASGPLFGFSDTWQLVINTSTTIVTFLMVFLIQNTQNRDTMALQLKLSELILCLNEAENRFAAAEDLSDEELEKLHEELRNRADTTLDHLTKRRERQTKKAS